MKTKLKNYFKIAIILLGITFFFSNCRNDEFITEQIYEQEQSSIKETTLSNLPKLTNYLNQNLEKDLKMKIVTKDFDSANTKSSDNILVLNLDENQVLQFINDNQKSNFSIKAIIENDNNILSSFKYIVVEYGNTYYSYIAEIVYDLEWLETENQSEQPDFSTFNGSIRIYNKFGLFVQESHFINGVNTTSLIKNPCNQQEANQTNTVQIDIENINSNEVIPTLRIIDESVINHLKNPCDENANQEIISEEPENCTNQNGESVVCENPITVLRAVQNPYPCHFIDYHDDPLFQVYFNPAPTDWLDENPCLSSRIIMFLNKYDYSYEAIDLIDLVFENLEPPTYSTEETTAEIINYLLTSINNEAYFDDNYIFEIDAINAARSTFKLLNEYFMAGPYNSSYFALMDEYTDVNLIDPTMSATWISHYSANYAIIKSEHSDWSEWQIHYEASKEMIHLAFDLAGMVPVVGIVFDVTNAIIYSVEGDGVNATLSIIGAIPVVGQWTTSAKLAKKVVTLSSGKRVFLKITKQIDGFVKFSYRGQLRKVLGLRGWWKHAHHIIPYSKESRDLVQMAAKYSDGIPGGSGAWHINDLYNGIEMERSLHLSGHAAYSDAIEFQLAELKIGLDETNPEHFAEAYNRLISFGNDLKSEMISHPDWTSGQFVDFIMNY